MTSVSPMSRFGRLYYRTRRVGRGSLGGNPRDAASNRGYQLTETDRAMSKL